MNLSQIPIAAYSAVSAAIVAFIALWVNCFAINALANAARRLRCSTAQRRRAIRSKVILADDNV